jgi:hypothetical protein
LLKSQKVGATDQTKCLIHLFSHRRPKIGDG